MKAKIKQTGFGEWVIFPTPVRKLSQIDRSSDLHGTKEGCEVEVGVLMHDTLPSNPDRGVAFFAANHNPAKCSRCVAERDYALHVLK